VGAYARTDAAASRDIEKVYPWFPRLKDATGRMPARSSTGGEQQMLAVAGR
jgi:ABC-type branched-subunit amino acid transport system ATPase component